MKSSRILALALLFAASAASRADEGEALAIKTIGGQTYSQCQVVHIYPDGVAFRHSRGMAKIQFTDLTPEWRKHFGYDAAKVQAYERMVQEDRAKAREAAAARAAEVQKAWAEAYVQELQAQAFLEAQQQGYQGGYGGYGYLDVGLDNGGAYGFGNQGNGCYRPNGNARNSFNYGLGNYSWITNGAPANNDWNSGRTVSFLRGFGVGAPGRGGSHSSRPGGRSEGGHGAVRGAGGRLSVK